MKRSRMLTTLLKQRGCFHAVCYSSFANPCHRINKKFRFRVHGSRNRVLQLVPVVSTSSNASDDSQKVNQLYNTIHRTYLKFYQRYEEYVGLTDVQSAQADVKKAERRFLEARGVERSIMREVIVLRNQLKHIRDQLSGVSFSSPLYPQLAKEQHELVTQEEEVKNRLEVAEDNEKDAFLQLSAAMRDSYEKERTRVERTKNWSIIGSVIGTILGFLGSSYINSMRTKELKQLVQTTHDVQLKESVDKIFPFVHERYTDVKEELTQLESALISKLVEPSSSENASRKNAFVHTERTTALLQQLQKDVGQVKAHLLKSYETAQQNTPERSAKSVSQGKDETGKELEAALTPATDITTKTDSSDAEETPASGRTAIKNMAIWGGIMTALYVILAV